MLFKLLSTLAVAAIAINGVAAGGYINSCGDCSLSNLGRTRLLACTCGDGNGGFQHTNIDINNCFANVEGYLVFRRNGDFVESCWNIECNAAATTILEATCNNNHGGSGYNRVDLNDYIENGGGKLACYG